MTASTLEAVLRRDRLIVVGKSINRTDVPFLKDSKSENYQGNNCSVP
jgi:hypothetical protein